VSADDPALPEQIGPYRILGLLGEGGMGVVYEAIETGALRRRVAVKVIRAGLATREILVRFDAERQALALMDHGGIAKVLNAGASDDGQPYVVMELVKGIPVNEYCDLHRLTTTARIELFIAICHAVQHAHQKGVIHRDLKPSNVLVVEEDGVPRPKIIDFGIAKAVGKQLTDSTLITRAGVALGTAAYMSPEQAESSGNDVDTRTDIYALGVMLYELLVGRLPVEPTAMGHHAFFVGLASRELPVPTPSARLNTLGRDGELVARARRTHPDQLRKFLKGDLDWIVLTALESERARRYPTANAFALDLQRALAHEPVSTGPPAATYRMRKFIRRHRVGVTAASVVILALAASTVAATLGLVRASRAEAHAAREASTAREVTDFVVGLFRVFDPDEPQGTVPARDITARELLERGAERASTELDGQPAQQGLILHTIGSAYVSLGLFADATRHLDRALTVRARALGPDHPELAETHLVLGQAARGSGDYVSAERHLERALAIRQASVGPMHTDAAQVMAALALVRWRQGRLAEAESLYLRVVLIDDASLDPTDPRLARDLMGLGVIYWSQGRFADAEPMMRRSLEIRESILGADHQDLASVLNNLGAVYFMLDRYDEALANYERARGIYERTLDPTHPNVASVLNNIGETQWRLGQLDLAEPLLRRALAIKEQRLAAGNPTIAVTLQALGGVLRDKGALAEAERAYRRALDIRVRRYTAGNPQIAETGRDLAGLLRRMGRSGEAGALESRLGLAAGGAR
jgi:non-specific serine/threonine protein kinase/serine/threonine-protein kinase